MGCRGSKTKDDDLHPYSDKVPLTEDGDASRANTELDEFANVPFIDATASVPTPFSLQMTDDDDAIKVKKLSGDDCIVQTSYKNEHFFNNEETLDKLKQEAFDVVKTRCRQSDEWEFLSHIQSASCSCRGGKDDCKCFDRSLMLRLIGIIRNENGDDDGASPPLNNLDQLGSQVGSASSSEDDVFDQKLQKCIGFLLEYAQSNSDKGSLLRAIGSKLSGEGQVAAANQQRNSSGIADFLKLTSGNDGFTVDSNEHENVEVTVKKTVTKRTVCADEDSLKEILQKHGLQYNEDMLNARQILIESDPPAELDQEIKKRAQMLMDVADSVAVDKTQNHTNGKESHAESDQCSISEELIEEEEEDQAPSPKLHTRTPTTSAETVLSEVVNELTEAIIKDM